MTLNQWIVNGRVGVSSKTIWSVLQGVDANDGDKPYDPSDFSRCWKLVTRCGVTREDLEKVSKTLPYWKPYIDNWEKLTEMYELNRSQKWKNVDEIGMHVLMNDLRKESDIIRRSNKKKK